MIPSRKGAIKKQGDSLERALTTRGSDMRQAVRKVMSVEFEVPITGFTFFENLKVWWWGLEARLKGPEKSQEPVLVTRVHTRQVTDEGLLEALIGSPWEAQAQQQFLGPAGPSTLVGSIEEAVRKYLD